MVDKLHPPRKNTLFPYAFELLSTPHLTYFCVSQVSECCQVMFEYQAKTEDELDLKKGDVIVILNKVGDICQNSSRLHRLAS